MKTNVLLSLLLCGVLTLAGTITLRGVADDSSKGPAKIKIYDTTADGTKQIEEALGKARKDGKHVLLQFGAEWCIWCHRLHDLCDSDKGISDVLKRDFVVVLIDVDKEHNKDVVSRYGEPTKFGLPVIVVLDAEGKQLTTKDTGQLEEGDHHSPVKVMAFLKEWGPKR